MGLLDKKTEENITKAPASQAHSHTSSLCNESGCPPVTITPEEQAGDARAVADLVDQMLAMPDEDPPGAWEEAMRDLDSHRPHRKLFEGHY